MVLRDMLFEPKNSLNGTYRTLYEKVLSSALRDANVSHGFESAIINIDIARNIRFTPDYALGLWKWGKQAVLETHSGKKFDIEFIEKMFFARRMAPEYYYVLITDLTKTEVNKVMNSFRSGFEEQHARAEDSNKKKNPEFYRNFVGWGEDASVYDIIYSELGLKAASRKLEWTDLCNELWTFPKFDDVAIGNNGAVKFYDVMRKALDGYIEAFKKSIGEDPFVSGKVSG